MAVNGGDAAGAKGGGFIRIRREGRDGDTVVLTSPMTLRTQTWERNHHSLSVSHGLCPALESCKIEFANVRSSFSVLRLGSYHLRCVPIHGGTPRKLLTVTRPLRTMLAAGPWLWCTEDGFPDTPGSRQGVLWRVAIDGSGAEEWLTGLRAPVGQLVRDENFIYLADTSYGGVERIHQVSPAGRSSRVIWEIQDLTRESHIRALTLTAGNLWWLDEHSLRTMPANGGAVRTVVDGIAFPHALAASASRVAWSEGAPGGTIRQHDLANGVTATLETTCWTRMRPMWRCRMPGNWRACRRRAAR